MRSSFYLWIGTCSGTDQCCGKSERNRAEDSLHSHSPASLSLPRFASSACFRHLLFIASSILWTCTSTNTNIYTGVPNRLRYLSLRLIVRRVLRSFNLLQLNGHRPIQLHHCYLVIGVSLDLPHLIFKSTTTHISNTDTHDIVDAVDIFQVVHQLLL